METQARRQWRDLPADVRAACGEVLTQSLPDTRFYRAMRRGHAARVGHELAAQLVSRDGGGIYNVERTCCDDSAYTCG